MLTAEQAIRSLQVEPARFRYLELLCRGFLSMPGPTFTRQYSGNDVKVLGEANRLLMSGLPSAGLRVHLLRALRIRDRGSAGENPMGACAASRGMLIAVSSGKGGVGKSTLSLNLGCELQQAGYRVVVVDGDLGTANLHVMAGLRVERTLEHVISGECSIEEIIHKADGFPDIVPGSSGLSELANLGVGKREALLLEVRGLALLYDLVLVDTAAGVSSHVIDFIVSSDFAVVLASPEKTAITDAYALIKLSVERKQQCRFGLVANRVRSAREGTFVLGRISGCARRFLNQQVLELGYIWEDSHARIAVNDGVPLCVEYPRSRASLSIKKIAYLFQEKHLYAPLAAEMCCKTFVGQPATARAGSVLSS